MGDTTTPASVLPRISADLALSMMSGRQWDDGTALALAEHAFAVYSAPDVYAGACLEAGFDGSLTCSAGSTQVGIAYGPMGIVVAARGSSDCGDWLENLQAWRVAPHAFATLAPTPAGASVHRGFRQQLDRILPSFIARLQDVRGRWPTAPPLWLAGHSLGAALAVMLAPALESWYGRAPAAVYLFDAPRVGNGDFATWWNGRYGDVAHRVVIVRRGVADIVTRVPPSSWGYWHVGRPEIIRDGIRYESEDQWDKLRAEDQVKPLDAWRVLSRLAMSVQSHRCRMLLLSLRVAWARHSQSALQGVPF